MAPPATTTISPQAVIGEFAMNALRLKGGVSLVTLPTERACKAQT